MGLKIGEWKMWDKNGTLITKGVYKKNGAWKVYNSNGELIKTKNFKKGKLIPN